MLRTVRGALVEYGVTVPPLAFVFEFNPETISRRRSISVKTGGVPGTRGGYDFTLPTETPRASQGVTVQPETLSVRLLVDATDRMEQGDPVATAHGVEPQLDVLRTLLEPKSQGPAGVQTLSSLGLAGERAFQRAETPSVLLFVWGTQVLPVFLTGISVEEIAHLPSLVPYRARLTIDLQVIEGSNPFTRVEKVRQVVSAALGTQTGVAQALGGLS
ncbi:MAG: hypothetical protein AAF560_12805 [Acidobacteriota bacterium]